MARARMLARNITKSAKFAQLTDAERVIYFCILPFLDREGRINAHPTYLKGHVFLLLEQTEEQIAKALERIHEVGLATLYPTEHFFVLQFTAFHDFNNVDKREAPSEFEGPSSELLERVETRPSSTRKTDPTETPRTLRGDSTETPNTSQHLRGLKENVNRKCQLERKEVSLFSKLTTTPSAPVLELSADEAKTETPPPDGTKQTTTPPPTSEKTNDPEHQQVFNLLRAKLKRDREGSDLLQACLFEDPTRTDWFTLPIARVRALIFDATHRASAHGNFKGALIASLDREAGTLAGKGAAASPPGSARPPGKRIDTKDLFNEDGTVKLKNGS